MGLAFAFIGIKLIVKKDGTFEKKCTSSDPTSKEERDCVCSGEDETKCEFYEEHHGVKASTPIE